MTKLLRISIIVAIVLCAVSVSAQEIPSDSWMGVYFGQTKIGYAEFNIGRTIFEATPCYRLQSVMHTKMLVMGSDVQQVVETTMYINDNYEPIYQHFKMSSGGSTTTVNARFSSGGIITEMESQGSKSYKTIPVPPGSKVIGDSTFFTYTNKLSVGDKIAVKTFNPLSLVLEDDRMEVLRKENLTIGTDTIRSFVIKSTTPMGDMMAWQDDKGNLLKAIGLMGITLIREPKEVALDMSSAILNYTPPSDLAVATSASTAIKIPNPREVAYLKARLTGINDRALIITDDRQKANSILAKDGKPVVEYSVIAIESAPAYSSLLPMQSSDSKMYLGDIPYVQPSNAAISDVAKKIIGKEKNAYVAASKIRAWVYRSMKPSGEKGVMRSSLDVLNTKTGVCRDYAVLYAALARSAGIPTKLVSGLVYWNGGFYFHAWAESYVGKWIPMDATLPTDFVDATHIKLVEGDVTSMFGMIKAIGSLGAEIVNFKER